MNEKKTIKFLIGTYQQYHEMQQHNPYYFYFLTDTNQVYLGDIQLSNTSGGGAIFHTVAEWALLEHDKSVKDQFYVYTDRQVDSSTLPGIKLGDGLAYIVDLPFLDSILMDHIQNTNIHVTSSQKNFWNNKMNGDPVYNSTTETLIFTKNNNS